MTLKYPNANSYAMQVMMLATAGVKVCLLEPPQSSVLELEKDKRQVIIPDDTYFQECVALITNKDQFRLKSGIFWEPERRDSFYVYRPNYECDRMPSFLSVKASEYLQSTERAYHLNITAIDVPIEDFLASTQSPFIRSLNLSRLGLTDAMIQKMVMSGRLKNLRFLDLSGNLEITLLGVESICASVHERQMPWLEQLDLLGTDCDASPYTDGHYWRISETAKKLSKRYGFQAWMMLGSKIPELENRELLTRAERDFFSENATLAGETR